MNKSIIFKATPEWQPISINGKNIKDGIFRIVSLGSRRVDFLKSKEIPKTEYGICNFMEIDDSVKWSLCDDERLYARTASDDKVEIEVQTISLVQT